MPRIKPSERRIRLFIQQLFSRVEPITGCNHAEIYQQALERFESELYSKLKNVQTGEYLFVQWRVDIITGDGKVRAGDGSKRCMPEYIEWRKAVYERDKYTCQECGRKGYTLNAHHIKSWAKYPDLRFDVDNGITLCEDCHQKKHPHLGFYGKKKQSNPGDT